MDSAEREEKRCSGFLRRAERELLQVEAEVCLKEVPLAKHVVCPEAT
jgi:hypothetical protein